MHGCHNHDHMNRQASRNGQRASDAARRRTQAEGLWGSAQTDGQRGTSGQRVSSKSKSAGAMRVKRDGSW